MLLLLTMDPLSKRLQVRRSLHIFWFFAKFAIAAIVVVVPIRLFVAQPFLVLGNSMTPTLNEGEYLVIDRLWYDLHTPQRGDVIILRYPLDPSIYFVKRIIGMPGETVSYTDGNVSILSADGSSRPLHEPYIIPAQVEQPDSIVTLAADEYYVLGDDRTQSSDSREWGPLQKKFIVGRAFMRLFPFGQIQILPGQYRYTQK